MINEKFHQIKALICDVDGVFTNSELLITEKGEMLRKTSTRDGQGVKQAYKSGLHIAIITGGNSEGIKERFQHLGIKDYHHKISDKLKVLESISKKQKIDYAEMAYIGDDLPDIPCMKKVAIGVCPNDAAVDVLAIADYICKEKGGGGCVREIIEKILRTQNKWNF